MTLTVPDEFREEILASSKEDLDDLRQDAGALLILGKTSTEIAAKMVAVGWSEPFANWYGTQMRLNGGVVDLHVPERSDYDKRLAAYEEAKRQRSNKMTQGWMMVFGAILVRAVASALASENNLAFLIFWPISFGLWFRGLFTVLDAKEKSRWWALVGLFVALVPDRNPLRPPSKTSGFVKGEESLVSDW